MAQSTPSIYIQPSHKGKERRAAHAKAGRDIPEKTLEKEKHSGGPAERKRATFAENARHWKHGK